MVDKKLFGQSEDNNPPLTDKLAFGTDTNNARNMTFTNFLSWLEGKLGFFKTSNNLSEANASAVRTNIDVYSTTEMNNALANKANTSDVLVKGQTDAYIPTTNYSPATKIYVDSSGTRVNATMTVVAGNANSCEIAVIQRGSIVTISGRFDSKGGDGSIGSPLPMAYISLTNAGIKYPGYGNGSFYAPVGVACKSADRPCAIMIEPASLSNPDGWWYVSAINDTDSGDYYFSITYVV